MGAGVFNKCAYKEYSTSLGRSYDEGTGRVVGQTYKAIRIDPSLDPKNFKIRECVNTEEHPNTIPVILALDVTGSMGEACSETASALGTIMTDLYQKFEDIEFCIMGIGDLDFDDAPIQMSQFESDIRIAEALDKVYMEHGGGFNAYESYTAAWYMGVKRTKLDCYDLQGRKGIIITMGDEPLNPYLPVYYLNSAINGTEQANIETPQLFEEASKKFDIFHIAVDSLSDCYRAHKKSIEDSFGKLLGSRYKVSSINQLASTISECISESIQNSVSSTKAEEGISW